MKATIVDLRYRMNDVLKALDRNEDVTILHRGRRRGVIKASEKPTATVTSGHPFFNLRPSKLSVEQEMAALRGGRHRDL